MPYLRVIHQPSTVYRIRYKKEKRTTFLYADNSATAGNHNELNCNSKKPVRKKTTTNASDGTFPKIEIVNGKGPGTVIVSCVSHTEPYYVHPHKLVGANCKSGVAIFRLQPGQAQVEISGISIEFTKKAEIDQSLNELKSKNVDPFNKGFDHDRDKIDLSKLRLCFQAYLHSLENPNIIRDRYHILDPIVTNVISNSACTPPSLVVQRTSHFYAPPDGDNEVTVVLKPLVKGQRPLYVKFFDDANWSKSFQLTELFQSTVIFKPPAYKTLDLKAEKTVWVKFFVPFDNNNNTKDKNNNNKKKKMPNGGVKGVLRSSSGENTNANDDQDMMVTINEETIDNEESMMNNNNNESDEEEEEEDEEESVQAQIKPDGKFESEILEFRYVPMGVPYKRKSDQQHFDLTETNDREKEGDEVNEQVRKNLAKRHCQIYPGLIVASNTAGVVTPSTSAHWPENVLAPSPAAPALPAPVHLHDSSSIPSTHQNSDLTADNNQETDPMMARANSNNVDVDGLLEMETIINIINGFDEERSTANTPPSLHLQQQPSTSRGPPGSQTDYFDIGNDAFIEVIYDK